jgi:RNA polymerase sigma-70 factor (ECF subfamily)
MRDYEPNEKRFDSLIQPHRAILIRYARRLTRGNAAEAEDLVQDTLIRAFTHLSTLQTEGNIRRWLHVVLRNLFLNQYKQRRGRPLDLSLEGHADTLQPVSGGRSETPERAVIRHMEYRASLRVLEALPAGYREPVTMAVIENLSYEEISHRLGLPMGTVRSRIARGRRQIRNQMTQWDTATSELPCRSRSRRPDAIPA